jgi:predicted transcriptional regulator
MKAELEGDDMYSKVLVYIQQNPGCHLRRIKNEIGMSMGLVQYQLFRLEKRGRITSIRRGLYKFYFLLVLNADFLYIIIEGHVPKQQYQYFLALSARL